MFSSSLSWLIPDLSNISTMALFSVSVQEFQYLSPLLKFANTWKMFFCLFALALQKWTRATSMFCPFSSLFPGSFKMNHSCTMFSSLFCQALNLLNILTWAMFEMSTERRMAFFSAPKSQSFITCFALSLFSGLTKITDEKDNVLFFSLLWKLALSKCTYFPRMAVSALCQTPGHSNISAGGSFKIQGLFFHDRLQSPKYVFNVFLPLLSGSIKTSVTRIMFSSFLCCFKS
jgi:hypothetical protein